MARAPRGKRCGPPGCHGTRPAWLAARGRVAQLVRARL